MLTLANIAQVLTDYQSRYRWLDVRAGDVRELREGLPVFQPIVPGKYRASANGRGLELTLYQGGLARFSLAEMDQAAMRAFQGAAIGAAAAAASKKDVPAGLLLGLLVGGLIGAASGKSQGAPDESRIMTLLFDGADDRWKVYQGPYVAWAKAALMPGALA